MTHNPMSKNHVKKSLPPSALAAMRNAMKEIMVDSYIAGSNDCYAAMKKDQLNNVKV